MSSQRFEHLVLEGCTCALCVAAQTRQPVINLADLVVEQQFGDVFTEYEGLVDGVVTVEPETPDLARGTCCSEADCGLCLRRPGPAIENVLLSCYQRWCRVKTFTAPVNGVRDCPGCTHPGTNP